MENLRICEKADSCTYSMCNHKIPHEYESIMFNSCDSKCNHDLLIGPCIEYIKSTKALLVFTDEDFLI